MRLADAGCSEHQDVVGLRDEVAGGELAHELAVDRGLELEVELLDGLDDRKVRDLDPHGDASLVLGVELLAQHTVEEVEVGRLAARGFGKERIESLRSRRHAQPLQLRLDASAHELAHHAPPAASVYASSERSNDGGRVSMRRAGLRHSPSKCCLSTTRACGSRLRT